MIFHSYVSLPEGAWPSLAFHAQRSAWNSSSASVDITWKHDELQIDWDWLSHRIMYMFLHIISYIYTRYPNKYIYIMYIYILYILMDMEFDIYIHIHAHHVYIYIHSNYKYILYVVYICICIQSIYTRCSSDWGLIHNLCRPQPLTNTTWRGKPTVNSHFIGYG